MTVIDQASQGSLFDAIPLMWDATFATAQRTELDESSWLEHVPGWLVGAESLFDELVSTAPWEQRRRWMYTREVDEPRLTAEYPHVDEAPQPALRDIAAALSAQYRTPYDRLWMNLYRDHRDGTGWHGDLIGKVQSESIVPVLSLGATRRFLIRPRDGGKSVAVHAAGGDLVVMGGRAQVEWRHSVPKQAIPATARISINFAPTIEGPR
jgi:alkylated DNA repair dioxygenase AlkB